MTEQVPSDQKRYRVDWCNKRTGFEHFDTVEATDVEDAIRKTRRVIRSQQRGVAEADVQFTYVGIFCE
jgi:hypothetical protein